MDNKNIYINRKDQANTNGPKTDQIQNYIFFNIVALFAIHREIDSPFFIIHGGYIM